MNIRQFLLLTTLVTPAVGQVSIYVPSPHNDGACPRQLVPGPTGARSNGRIQWLLPRARFATQTVDIQEMSLHAADTPTPVVERIAFDRLVVRMAHRDGALSNRFDDNVAAGATTVLELTDHQWNVESLRWNAIGLQRSYTFDPTNADLVVELEFFGGRLLDQPTAPSVPFSSFLVTHGQQWITNVGWSGSVSPATGAIEPHAMDIAVAWDVGDAQTFGRGCGVGALDLEVAGDPRIGAGVAIETSGAAVGAPIGFLFGFRNDRALALDPIGAPGCRLYVDVWASSAGTFADVGGRADFSMPLPLAPELVNARVYAQAFAVDPSANALGVVLSDYGRVLIGR